EEARGLLLHGLDEVRVRVTDVETADTAGEINEGVAVDIRQRRSPPFRGDDREVHGEGLRDDEVLAREDLLRPRAGDLRLQADRPCDGHTVTITTDSACPAWEAAAGRRDGGPRGCRRPRRSRA